MDFIDLMRGLMRDASKVKHETRIQAEAKKGKKNRYGNQGAGSSAYDEAAEALDEESEDKD